jgi:hypothetical protein
MGHKVGKWNNWRGKDAYANHPGKHKTQSKGGLKVGTKEDGLGECRKTADSKGQSISRPATGDGEYHERWTSPPVVWRGVQGLRWKEGIESGTA